VIVVEPVVVDPVIGVIGLMTPFSSFVAFVGVREGRAQDGRRQDSRGSQDEL
jgi:hypothetical protein